MIRSMTAFASGERKTKTGTLTCELRAVNHRYLELFVRLPDEMRVLEPSIRESIASRVQRGKLEIALRIRPDTEQQSLQLDMATVDHLAGLSMKLSGKFPELRCDFVDLLHFPGVMQTTSLRPEEMHAEVQLLLRTVLDDFIATREREGAMLAKVILERVDGIEEQANQARQLMSDIRAGQRNKLEARLVELKQPVDPGRLEQELVLWLQKLDVEEELDRLNSHIKEIRRIFKQDEPVGRRLDFLLQEFNREANTFGSKSVDARTTAIAVELKVLIDQIREQVQNIE